MRAAVFATASCLAASAFGQSAPPRQDDREYVLASAREIITNAGFCTLITVDSDGNAQARIVGPTPPDADMTVWIATNSYTRKVGQIRADPRITLSYFDSLDPSYVTMLGNAEIVEDPAEKQRIWRDEWVDYYPSGPTGDDFTLIRFSPRRLEIVSESRGFSSDPKTWRPAAIEFPAAHDAKAEGTSETPR